MSRSIDEKVVELKFDNKQFESGVKASLGTLEKLKEAVTKNISSKSLEGVSKAAKDIDVSNAVKGIEALADRFSTLGIVGMRVIQNITDGLMNGMARGIQAVKNSIFTGGFNRAMNIENARFQLQGILSDASEVEEVMNQASESVDGTAYAFDSAAKAASMFTASGVKSGDQLMHALRGLAGATATFNADYESMSMIWTKISGQGRVMGDELNQLSNRGMNAAASIAQYFNAVNKEPEKASESVRAAIQELTNGLDVTEGDIRAFVTAGEISFDIFSEAMSETFGEHAKDANKTFSGALSNIKAALARTGEKIFAPLIRQEGPMVNLFNAIRIKINEFNAAFNAANGMVAKFTKWAEVVINKLTDWISNLKIANTYVHKWSDDTTTVMESATKTMMKFGDGTERIMSKQVYTPFHAFQDIVYSIVNIFKAIGSIISPVARAFKEAFSFDTTGVYKGIEGFRKFTESLILSSEQAAKLQKLFSGIFKVIASIIRIFIRLASSIRGVEAPSIHVADNFFDLAESVGNALEKFADFIDNSPAIAKALEIISTGVKTAKDVITGAISGIQTGFQNFDANTLIGKISKSFDSLRQTIFNALPSWAQDYLLQIQEIFGQIVDDVSILDFSAIDADFRSLGDVFHDFSESILKLSEWKDRFVSFFDFSDEESGINNFIAKGNEFVDWFKKHIIPAFDNVSVPGVVGGGGMLYVLYTVGQLLLGLAKIMKGGGATLTELPKTLKSLRGALNAYTADFKTDSLKKVAESILMIAGAIFVLAMIKPERLLPAVIAIGVIGAVLVAALHKLNSVPKEATTLATVLNTAAKGLKSALTNFGKSIKIKAFSNAVLKFVISIGIIIAEILAVKNLWSQGPEAFKNAASIVAIIGAALLGMALIMSLVGQKLDKGMKAFAAVGIGVLALSLAVGMMIWGFKSIMDLELPADYQEKVKILIGICAGIGVLILAFGLASRLAAAQSSFQISKDGLNKQSWNKGIGTMPLLGMVAMMIASVWAVKQLMAMSLPSDWKKKVGILAGIFVALGALILVVGKANQMAGGKGLKAFGTIIGMCIFIGVAIAALKVLGNFDGEILMKGMISLAGILFMLGFVLKSAGSIQKGAGGAVLAMALMLVVIVGALSVLSMFSGDVLLKAILSLGSILLVLAVVFAAVGKINNGNSWKPVLAMCLMVGVITAALMVLSRADWKGLLASAVSMSAVLVALTYAFRKISGSSVDPKKMVKKVGTFLLLSLSLVIIGGVLGLLANFTDWANILASSAAITAVMLAYTKAFETISKSKKISVKDVGMFLLGCVSTIIIATALWIAAMQPWQQILAAGAAISVCLLAMAGAFKVLNSIPQISGESIGAMLIGAVGCCLIGFALSLAAGYPWEQILAAGGAISACLLAMGLCLGIIATVINGSNILPAIVAFAAGVAGVIGIGHVIAELAQVASWEQLLGTSISIAVALLAMAVVMGICALVGTVAGPALAGIAVFDVFIADLTAVITALGAIRQIPHFDELFGAGSELLINIGKVIGDFIGSIIEGIGEGIGRALEHIGTSLSNFMTNASVFFDGLRSFDDGMVQGAKALAGVILAISAAEFISGISDLLSVFTGGLFGNNNSFGEKLASFGQAISDFDAATQSISDPYRFKAIAEGTQYLVDLSKSLPNSGGLLGDIMGNNDMDTWGGQLVVMGQKVAEFAGATAGISDDQYAKFQSFADSVQALIDMSKSLPNSGGLLGDIMGNNDMDTWGGQLVVMGQKVAEFAGSIQGITDKHFAKFQPFADAVNVLIEMSKSLPNSGGLLGDIMGNNDMDDWGRMLVSLGNSVSSFANSISGIDGGVLGDQAIAIAKLVSAIELMSGFYGQQGASNFAEALNNLAEVGLKNFVDAFGSYTGKAESAVINFLVSILKAIRERESEFKTLGIKSIDNYILGIKSKLSAAYSMGRQVAQKVIDAMTAMLSSFKSVGARSVSSYVSGLSSGTSSAVSVVKAMINTVVSNMNPTDDEGTSLFYKAGVNAGEGYVKGLSSQLKSAQEAGAKLASATSGSTAKEQQSKSPAKVFIKLGSYAGEGYVIGLLQWAKDAYAAGKELANTTNAGIEGIDIEDPVIKPMVDLTNVMDAAGIINSLFSSAMTSTMNSTALANGSMTLKASGNFNGENQNGQVGLGGNTYNFIQNNNSPKALSRVDIYRDTRHQFQQFREAVEGI